MRELEGGEPDEHTVLGCLLGEDLIESDVM
jgi:hypothetical protein